MPNSEKLRLKSGRAALLAELPPPPAPPPPPPLPPTRRHCQKYYFGGGEGEMQKGKGFSTIGASIVSALESFSIPTDMICNLSFSQQDDESLDGKQCCESSETMPNPCLQRRRCQMERHHREREARRSKEQRTAERGTRLLPRVPPPPRRGTVIARRRTRRFHREFERPKLYYPAIFRTKKYQKLTRD